MNSVIHKLGLLAACLMTLLSCEGIGEDNRYIEVVPATPTDGGHKETRRVLIEDFTGQRCVNCPDAAVEIEKLKAAYGADTVIAVGIHGGELAFWGTDKLQGLRTDLGDEYNRAWNVEAWPQGLVNRNGHLANIDQWFTLVSQALRVESPLSIAVSATFDPTKRQLSIETNTEAFETVSGKLQVWLTESGIVAMQSMPDGTNNREYVHNHVLRAAVNGSWGEDFSAIQGQQATMHHRFDVADTWQPDRLSVVVFVYNDQGVMQVAEADVQSL